MKLKAFILLALAVLVFSAPVLVTVKVSAPKLNGVLWDVVTNDPPLHPCGDPVEDPEIPH